MKKFKVLIMLGVLILLGGCMSVSVEVFLKNDDTGKFVMTVGYEESYLEEVEGDVDLNLEEGEDITFVKDGKNYIGKKREVFFDSFDDFLSKLEDLNDVDENDVDENDFNDSFINKLSIIREGNKVKVYQEADLEAYEESKMFLNYIDYHFIFVIEGEIIEHNADKQDGNKLEWGIESILSKGMQFEYTTPVEETKLVDKKDDKKDNNFIPFYIGGGVVLLLGFVGFLETKRNKG